MTAIMTKMSMARSPLVIGNRVSREGKYPGDARRYGVIVACYHSAPQRGMIIDDWWLYAVKWDAQDGHASEVLSGYMREGLQVEPAVDGQSIASVGGGGGVTATATAPAATTTIMDKTSS